MKIFLAGATGAIGARLVPLLVNAGHEVTGMTRSPGKTGLLEGLGARPVVADALDPDAVGQAVAFAEPEAIVHQLTAIPPNVDPRRLDRQFALTNRLRTQGTDHLLAAGRAVGVRRFVAQSFAGWPFARTGGPVKTEDDPLDDDPLPPLRETHAAILHLERAVTGAEWTEGIVLRYAGFYGPGTSIALDTPSPQVEAIRRRRFPIVGPGTGVWSFIHIDDAAAATVAALERGRRGIYQIADDEPAPVSEWLPALAEAVGAKPPRRIPKWLGRMVAGKVIVTMLNDLRGASNEKARRELGWRPHWASWRDGFRHGLR